MPAGRLHVTPAQSRPVLDTGLESGETDKMDSGFRRNDGAKSALNPVASARQ